MKPRQISCVLRPVQTWETIQKEYPDKFVLLENTVYDPITYIKEATVLYKHYHRKKVIDKELELNPKRSAIVYTGGARLEKANKDYTFVL